MSRGETAQHKPLTTGTRQHRARTWATNLSWLYAAGITLWYALHHLLGDAAWWLALLNAFVPFLFVPLAAFLSCALICRSRALWASLVPPLLVLLMTYGGLFVPTWPPARAATETSLTVMSFNLWGGSESAETAHVVADHGLPDVVALQELTPHMARVLLEELGDVYPYHAFDAGIQAQGMGVLSRYPLAELDVGHLQRPGWRLQVIRVETPQRALTLYSIHPHATNVLRYIESGTSIADQVRASVRTREAGFERLAADLLERRGPIIVAGDLNCTDQSVAYAALATRLTDAHRAVGWGLGHTFPAYAGSYRGIPILPRQMRIDMIFSSQELIPLRCYVGSSHGESDHLPVVAEFAWDHQ